MEGFLWVVVALGLTAFVARHHKTAAVLFGLAASMKMFPGILLLLLLARKRYKELVVVTKYIFSRTTMQTMSQINFDHSGR